MNSRSPANKIKEKTFNASRIPCYPTKSLFALQFTSLPKALTSCIKACKLGKSLSALKTRALISEIVGAPFLCEIDAGGVFVGLIDAMDADPTLTLTNKDGSIIAKLNETTIRRLLQAFEHHQDWVSAESLHHKK